MKFKDVKDVAEELISLIIIVAMGVGAYYIIELIASATN